MSMAPPQPAVPAPRRRPVPPLLVGAAVAVCFAAGLAWGVASQIILPGVTVEGVRLGGRTRAEAAEQLHTELNALLRHPVHLTYGNEGEQISLDQAGLRVNIPATLGAAYAPGHQDPLADRWKAWLKAGRGQAPVPAVLRWDEQAFATWLATLRERYGRPGVETGWQALPNGLVEVTPGRIGRDVSEQELRRRLREVAFAPAGRRVVELPLYTVHPRRTMEEALAMGIHEVVASYRTEFDSEDQDRAENVRLAAAALDQIALQPGEVFSFNRTVGPRLPASGYREAPVVVNGRLVPGIGGGVCQVSSTLYNAILLANLAVVTRHPHSIPLGYVPPGRDAAVAYDSLDLEFRNTGEGPVVIDTEAGPGWLEARVLGQRRPDEWVELRTKILETYPPSVEEVPDPSLPVGKRVEVSWGALGYRARVWLVLHRNGVEVERRLLSDDRYQPLQGIVRVGTGPAPRP